MYTVEDCVEQIPLKHDPLPSGTDASRPALPSPPPDILPHFIKAEANLLRLPLFALTTKGLKTLDGIECHGKTTRDGQTHDYVFRATRNTATLYPGPLARSAHQAILSLATDAGLPVVNPITWSWREFCRRMGITSSGQIVRHIKAALKATRGLIIESRLAIYSKPDKRPLSTGSHERYLSLYSDLVFMNDRRPDGTVADTNAVWLADWYLANINALFTAPLNYSLWLWLDQRSPIASRLYEFLLINFYSGVPALRINYDTLAQFLPIHRERYYSSAVRQLETPLRLLALQNVIETTTWSKTKAGRPQLQLHRGLRLTAPGDRDQRVFEFMTEEFAGSIEVTELRNLKPPEWGIVSDFYRLWAGDDSRRPTPKELTQARELITEHGQAKAKALIPLAVARMKLKFPDAKTFGACNRYIPEVAAHYDREQQRDARHKESKARARREQEEAAEHQRAELAFKTTWLPRWQQLDPAEQAAIRQAVVSDKPFLQDKQGSSIFLQLCLKELADRSAAADQPTT